MSARHPMLHGLLLLAASALAGHAAAEQDEPLVEVSVTPDQVSVGEPVTLRVSVYVPTWFSKPPTFPSFEIPNAITRLPPNSSRPTSKRVGRESWSGVTRNYQVFPLMGASFRLDSQVIILHIANPGGDSLRAEVATGDIAFAAVVPQGAEGLDPYVAGTRFELSRSIEGDPDELAVGDALVVVYTAELDGLSAIFIPDLVAMQESAGVSMYPDQPVVDDGTPARRTEQVTYIFNAGGEFEVPAVSIDWWNSESGAIETASLPPVPVFIEGAMLEDEGSAGAVRRTPLRILAVLGTTLVLAWVLRRRIVRLLAKHRERERRRLESESYAWGQARKGLDSGDKHLAYAALLGWLERLEPGLDSRRFAAKYGDEELAAALSGLSSALYSSTRESPDLARLRQLLAAARKRFFTERQEEHRPGLPVLNP